LGAITTKVDLLWRRFELSLEQYRPNKTNPFGKTENPSLNPVPLRETLEPILKEIGVEIKSIDAFRYIVSEDKVMRESITTADEVKPNSELILEVVTSFHGREVIAFITMQIGDNMEVDVSRTLVDSFELSSEDISRGEPPKEEDRRACGGPCICCGESPSVATKANNKRKTRRALNLFASVRERAFNNRSSCSARTRSTQNPSHSDSI
jgi:hypothetical protein